MSKINDALNRAKDVELKNMPSSVAPMRPIYAEAGGRDLNWLWPIAIILLVVVAGIFIATSPEKRTAAEPTVVAAPEVKAVTVPAAKLPPVAANPVVTPVKAIKPLQLQGIIYDPAKPYAIIGGKTVFVGDSVDEMRVTTISRDAITLAGNGQTKTLTVGRP